MQEIRHVFIVNPAAGSQARSAEAAAEIARATREAGVEYAICQTEYPRHACLLVREAAQAEPGRPLRFYACGGDGTLNEVVTTAARVENCSVTHFPTGSGNDFIKVFGPRGARRFFDLPALMAGHEIELDYIESDCGVAANILSVGVDARVAQSMRKYRRVPGLRGQGAYLAAALENLIRGLHDPYRVEVDGEVLDGRYTMIVAANGRWYGGGFHAAPDADPQDGLLDVLLVRAVSRLQAASILAAYKAGRYRELGDYIAYRRAREMTLRSASERPMALNLDGEVEQTARVSLRVARQKMRFVVPEGVAVAPPGL